MLLGLLVLPAIASNAAVDNLTAFPPEHCIAGQAMYMSWDGIHSTACKTGQELFHETLGCAESQTVVYEGGKYTCKTLASPPACGSNELLTYNGTIYSCVHNDVPTCGTEQVLTFDGGGFICVNRTDNIPTCSTDQFLTYNGSAFQCANTQTVSWPKCGDGQVLSSDGNGPVCVDATTGGGTGQWCGFWREGGTSIACHGTYIIPPGPSKTLVTDLYGALKWYDLMVGSALHDLTCPNGYQLIQVDTSTDFGCGGDNGTCTTVGKNSFTCIKP